MAVYRQIQTTFWQDDFVLQLTPEEKYFFLFLLTNSKTKQCGIYQLPAQVIMFETGYNQETVEKLLTRFVDYGKIIYSSRTKEIGIVNWPKYNPMESPKIKACVVKELKEVKDKSLIARIYPENEFVSFEKKVPGYPIQGVSQEEKEKEKEKKEAEAAEEEKEEESGMPPATAAAAEDIFINKNKSTPPLPSFHREDLGKETSLPFSSENKSEKLRKTKKLFHPDSNRFRTFRGAEFRNDCASSDNREKEPQGNISHDDYGDYKCEGIKSQAEMLFIRVWNKLHPNPEECRIVAEYIISFGFNEVETVFKEAVKYDKKKLAYVETVLKKRKERADVEKKKEEERRKRHEAELKAEEQRKRGIGLHLIKDVFGKNGNNPLTPFIKGE
jgi:hypothetical protein